MDRRRIIPQSLIKQFANMAGVSLRQEIALISSKVSKGACRDMEEYREETGKIKGLTKAINMINDLATKAEVAEQDDPEPPPSQ